ncbi:uncharacterized protein ACLA_049300 [Aspergillus clavatus NRRL 1]|uniref:Rhodopsin domain-containing protein n=1 Tax=Aspergillus clavatus (strain ATCC 1007 / CBS 513.65 / DSM 816 / NCTC 3887 / NRRL 1 / QM 1276 / 107) TaxID=344612 RepID=A1CHV3_ASPCL|nr:uncharacterized protein ACLA_049300 [Aspergillus clavatus NRRL 1]EAW10458.1 conserved hypothetical protein [Aspergillus clavatus NRRL 1]
MGPYVPPGQSPPFQVVDDLHHGAWIIITAALGLVVSLVCLFIRVYVRLALCPPFASDDYVLLGATLIAIIQSSLVFEAASQGFGTSIKLLEQYQIDKIQTVSKAQLQVARPNGACFHLLTPQFQLITVSDVLYLITIYVSKCCVVGIYLRLTPQKVHNRISWATLVLCTLWIIPSAFILAINCEMNRPWTTSGGQCRHLLERWAFITAMDILTELILFALAVTLLQGLFMPVRRKFTIGSAFFFRLPLIIFSVFHIYTLKGHYHSPDPTLSVVTSKIWSQVELNYALTACSVFCLRPFMAAVSTNYGTAGDSNLKNSNASGTPKGDSSASKSQGGSASAPRTRVGLPGEERRTWRSLWWEQMKKEKNRGDCEKGHQVTGGLASDQAATETIELVEQQGIITAECARGSKMIIRKDVQYSVEYNRKKSDASLSTEAQGWDRYLGSGP